MPSLSPSNLNKKYTETLHRKPLLTKALTLTFLALLNEQLASLFAGDIKSFKVGSELSIPHLLSEKVPLMGIFAFFINAPVTHYGYSLIQKLVPSPLTPRKKLLQILLSTGIITPILSALFVSWIGLINNISAFKKILKKNSSDKISDFIKAFKKTIYQALKSNFLQVTYTSALTSPLFMLFAQKFVIPEAWTVFFAICYFVVGTYNNTLVKQNQIKLKKEKEAKEALKLKVCDVDSIRITKTDSD
ncbi:hypothetical protein CANINC_003267 [Pichia inconspicua]|uniref:Uncharacterized protein n=1 Tax=Pichia inconspicua TaxID=52247 RepID=A0A4T0WZ71_9ASCO|nr:hypothetical protein CANINC_003267 [[Candida] inconspicua]